MYSDPVALVLYHENPNPKTPEVAMRELLLKQFKVMKQLKQFKELFKVATCQELVNPLCQVKPTELRSASQSFDILVGPRQGASQCGSGTIGCFMVHLG